MYGDYVFNSRSRFEGGFSIKTIGCVNKKKKKKEINLMKNNENKMK
jgi:hypothetical protein